MENQNNSNFTIVSMDVFAQVLSQIPKGKIIRVSDLMEILSERGLVNKETLHAAREKLNSITDTAKAE